MLTPLQQAYRFIRGDGSLTVAVVILSFYVFVLGPLAEIRQVNRLGLDLFFAAFLAAGAHFVFEPRPIQRAFMLFLALTVAFRSIDYYFDERWISTTSAALSGISAFFLGWLFLVRALRDGRVNIHRIMGAVGSFLLIGVIFAEGFRLLALHIPAAFAAGGTPTPIGDFAVGALYFSFITLTSLGFGDVVPLHPIARSLATLEAVSGQLFLAILISRLVSLEIEWRSLQREHRAAAMPAPQRGEQPSINPP